jgi:hypothetical protein
MGRDRLHTALGVVGASADSGGPGLVGRRLVALRQNLAALGAPPAFELQTRSIDRILSPSDKYRGFENTMKGEERKPAGRRRAG